MSKRAIPVVLQRYIEFLERANYPLNGGRPVALAHKLQLAHGIQGFGGLFVRAHGVIEDDVGTIVEARLRVGEVVRGDTAFTLQDLLDDGAVLPEALREPRAAVRRFFDFYGPRCALLETVVLGAAGVLLRTDEPPRWGPTGASVAFERSAEFIANAFTERQPNPYLVEMRRCLEAQHPALAVRLKKLGEAYFERRRKGNPYPDEKLARSILSVVREAEPALLAILDALHRGDASSTNRSLWKAARAVPLVAQHAFAPFAHGLGWQGAEMAWLLAVPHAAMRSRNPKHLVDVLASDFAVPVKLIASGMPEDLREDIARGYTGQMGADNNQAYNDALRKRVCRGRRRCLESLVALPFLTDPCIDRLWEALRVIYEARRARR